MLEEIVDGDEYPVQRSNNLTFAGKRLQTQQLVHIKPAYNMRGKFMLRLGQCIQNACLRRVKNDEVILVEKSGFIFARRIVDYSKVNTKGLWFRQNTTKSAERQGTSG